MFTALVLLVTYLFLCGLAASVARNKGKDPAGYFFLALLLTPLVGLIAALVVKPDTARLERQRVASGRERKCPFCAEVIKAEATVCRFCGRDLPAPTPSTPLTLTPGRRSEFGPKDRIRWGLVAGVIVPILLFVAFASRC